ncbi:MAG: CHAP domain-containing protein [Novosphingobium sp.]
MSSGPIKLVMLGILAALPAMSQARPVAPDPAAAIDDSTADESRDFGLPYIQCVPYARQVSGIQLRGDAHTWWDQAAGRYARGSRPRVGAVMSFHPYGAMQLGHVAAVSKVVDSRTVLLRHANWSPIDGRRGQMEDNVRAVDVSPEGDWSKVRVWFAPLGGLGTTHWPVDGFIYNQRPPKTLGPNARLAVLASADAPSVKPAYTSRIGADFLKGIVPETRSAQAPARRQLATRETVSFAPQALKYDPIGRIIASRMR